MIVVGGGAVGCEYACIFAALGVRVTLLTNRMRLLAHLDAELGAALRQQMKARLGASFYLDTDVSYLANEHGRAVVRLGGETELSADCALYSAGRVGASAGLGLENAGVRANSRGFILTDEHYRTSQRRIYAAGDVIGFPALASTSMEQARMAVCHAFDLRYKQSLAGVLLEVIYMPIEIASV